MDSGMATDVVPRRGASPPLRLPEGDGESVQGQPPAARALERSHRKPSGLYATALLSRRIVIGIQYVGQHLKGNIEERIRTTIEGRCAVEGFVKPGSTKLVSFSSGLIKGGDIQFDTVIECQVCNPVEGMLIGCVARNITKAGIRAEIAGDLSPVVVFIARDHSHMDPQFNAVAEGDNIRVRVVGQRFELHDKFISVIAELVDDKHKRRPPPPKLVIA